MNQQLLDTDMRGYTEHLVQECDTTYRHAVMASMTDS